MRTLLLLLLTIFVASCTQTPTLTRAEEFERKARCAALWNPTQERIREEEAPRGVASIEEMFYSPSLNTCVVAYQVVYLHLPTDTSNDTPTTLFVIRDALAGNTVFLKNIQREASAEADWTLRRAELKKATLNQRTGEPR